MKFLILLPLYFIFLFASKRKREDREDKHKSARIPSKRAAHTPHPPMALDSSTTDIWLCIAREMDTLPLLWNFFFTCKAFSQAVLSDPALARTVRSSAWKSHYLCTVAKSLNYVDWPVLEAWHKEAGSRSYAFFSLPQVISLLDKSISVAFSREILDRYHTSSTRPIEASDMLNRWIPRRAQTTARFILIQGRFMLKVFWIPANLDTADIFLDFHLASVVYPAVRAGFQGFAPHLLHRYILPAWRQRHKEKFGMRDTELKQLRAFAPFLSLGLSTYFRWVVIARLLETGQQAMYPFISLDALMEEIRVFMVEGLNFSWSDLLIPNDAYMDHTNFWFCEGILMIARHWQMDVEAVRRNFPVQYLFDKSSITLPVSRCEQVAFEEIVGSMTYTETQYRQVCPYPPFLIPYPPVSVSV